MAAEEREPADGHGEGFYARVPLRSRCPLVPDLAGVTKLPYYWGDLDRHQAEALLQGSADGTFLLRNSALDGCSFAVTFRRLGLSLHIRVQHRDGHFSFHRGGFRAASVPDLLQHYNDPKFCTFFEPLLSRPHIRNAPLSLQELCRAALNGSLTYDGIEDLPLPRAMRSYLRRCHYK
ncbi:suppressor of cytokine signaling 4-like [Spea bombifrons]|uniref:suppressor of cytokine signaling 4-like n=1 Tax=Spea bombifrons TaxID=233779 RepID=UPI00234B63AE|nr:suppressor of cytokine signaling 4-like [Spea bombifrons]